MLLKIMTVHCASQKKQRVQYLFATPRLATIIDHNGVETKMSSESIKFAEV